MPLKHKGNAKVVKMFRVRWVKVVKTSRKHCFEFDESFKGFLRSKNTAGKHPQLHIPHYRPPSNLGAAQLVTASESRSTSKSRKAGMVGLGLHRKHIYRVP